MEVLELYPRQLFPQLIGLIPPILIQLVRIAPSVY